VFAAGDAGPGRFHPDQLHVGVVFERFEHACRRVREAIEWYSCISVLVCVGQCSVLVRLG
jgi:hypothetical protein